MPLQEGGGSVCLHHNILNKWWDLICRVTYNPAAVTNKTKIHGFTAAGESPTTVGRGGQIWGIRGDSYAEESEFVADLCEDMGLIGFWDTC